MSDEIHEMIAFPRGECMKGTGQADRQCYGRAKVALEADTHRKDSFVTLVLKPYVIGRNVCVVGQGSQECDARWFGGGSEELGVGDGGGDHLKGGFEAASLLCTTSAHEICSPRSLCHFLCLLLSVFDH